MAGGPVVPLSVIASWPPRSENPVRRGWAMTVSTMVLFILTTTIVALRLYARRVIMRNAGLDDIVIIIGMVPLLGLAIVTAGYGRWWYTDRHIWDLTVEQGIVVRKVAVAGELFFVLGNATTKTSVLLFYRRMAKGSFSHTFIWAVRGCIMFVVAYAITFVMLRFLGCRPMNAFWNEVDPAWVATHIEGKDWSCVNEPAAVIAATFLSTLADFVTCILPLTLFWKLSLPREQKIGLCLVFGLGLFTCIAAGIRSYYVWSLFFSSYDLTWLSWDTWIWTSIELHLGVISASLPALRAYFRSYIKPAQIRKPLITWQAAETITICEAEKAAVSSLGKVNYGSSRDGWKKTATY